MLFPLPVKQALAITSWLSSSFLAVLSLQLVFNSGKREMCFEKFSSKGIFVKALDNSSRLVCRRTYCINVNLVPWVIPGFQQFTEPVVQKPQSVLLKAISGVAFSVLEIKKFENIIFILICIWQSPGNTHLWFILL